MKFGEKPRKRLELKDRFHPLNVQMNRLMVLNTVWDKTVGSRGKFWVLAGVEKKNLVVEVKHPAARHELALQKENIVKELNKFFDRRWIEDIKIV